ncbi:MAG TPA: endolytic transglycosylase MltG [Actinomycetota bacterium]|nr:endolytic transglycosylase MltG [Actinomycetota bacterium]
MRKLLTLGVVLLLLAGSAAVGYGWIYDKGTPSGRPVQITVNPGDSGGAIAQELEDKGVVESGLAFRVFVRITGANTDLKAGKYTLRTGMPFSELLEVLRKGPQEKFIRLTIPEGLNLEQIAGVVGEKTHIPAPDFLAAATPQTVRPSPLPPDSVNLEGFLYPATYFVSEEETPTGLVTRMVEEFEERAAEAGLGKDGLDRTPYEYVIIASMIEEEAKANEERGKISSVIHNRLERGIPLGIDATIQYAVKKYGGEPLTRSDLEIDSPYNSRTRTGLPPTPIASPRLASIKAAIEPESTNLLYYVLAPDCVHHVFTADYSEFEAAKQRAPDNC